MTTACQATGRQLVCLNVYLSASDRVDLASDVSLCVSVCRLTIHATSAADNVHCCAAVNSVCAAVRTILAIPGPDRAGRGRRG